jgi:CMP-N-acetylneuraminic acid synthetase
VKIAIQIPIKAAPSQRVPGKNFRPIAGKPLFAWLLDELAALRTPADVYIDSEDSATFRRVGGEVRRMATSVGLFAPAVTRNGRNLYCHLRAPWFATDEANGHHLLHQFAVAQPHYDLYAQAFVTAPGLTAPVIDSALGWMTSERGLHDSLFLATEESGFIWYRSGPINQQLRPDGLPRTQDATYLKETTGLYIITRDALFRTGCRIGQHPNAKLVDRRAALDIDTEQDFAAAEKLLAACTP